MEQPMAAGTAERTTQPRVREPLSRERIICAARDFIDRECLSDLSMRKLGSELGVEAMSLYRYFPSKSELLDAVLDRIAQGLELPSPGDDWKGAVRRFARSFREVGRSHPRIFPLLASSPAGQPAMQRAKLALSGTLGGAGFDEVSAAHAECAVIGFVMGSTLWLLGDGDGAGAAEVSDAEFDFGLDVILAGLEAKLASQPSAVGS